MKTPKEVYESSINVVWLMEIQKENVVEFGTAISINENLILTSSIYFDDGQYNRIMGRRIKEDGFNHKLNIVFSRPFLGLTLLEEERVGESDRRGSFGNLAKNGALGYGAKLYSIGNYARMIGFFSIGNAAFPCVDREKLPPISENENMTCLDHNGDGLKEFKETPLCRMTGDIFHQKRLKKVDTNEMKYEAKLHSSLPIIHCNGFSAFTKETPGCPVFNCENEIVGIRIEGVARKMGIALHVSVIHLLIDLYRNELNQIHDKNGIPREQNREKEESKRDKRKRKKKEQQQRKKQRKREEMKLTETVVAQLYLSQHSLYYFYILGMVCIPLKSYPKALELLYNVPMSSLSGIVVEAYKKDILILLIHLGQLCIELVSCYGNRKVSELELYIEATKEKFESDYNLGWVKQVLSSMYRRNIQRLTQTYLTLSLEDTDKTVELSRPREAEMHVLQKMHDGENYAAINQNNGMLRFLEDPEQHRTCEMFERFDFSIQGMMRLSKKLTSSSKRGEKEKGSEKEKENLKDRGIDKERENYRDRVERQNREAGKEKDGVKDRDSEERDRIRSRNRDVIKEKDGDVVRCRDNKTGRVEDQVKERDRDRDSEVRDRVRGQDEDDVKDKDLIEVDREREEELVREEEREREREEKEREKKKREREQERKERGDREQERKKEREKREREQEKVERKRKKEECEREKREREGEREREKLRDDRSQDDKYIRDIRKQMREHVMKEKKRERHGGKLTTKARDHFILKSDRPPHVTILCRVRDAAARFPGSIGTRADVCTLIRDSYYIVEDVSDAQINQVVSGAMDRLHYERDPCVQFDGERKLWVYLHRDREEEDFEDDGSSSTKKWKMQKIEAPEPFEQEMVIMAYHGGGEQSGIDLGSDLNAKPSPGDEHKTIESFFNDGSHSMKENVEIGVGSELLEQSGFNLGSDLNAKPSYGDEHKAMESFLYDSNHMLKDNVEIGVGSELEVQSGFDLSSDFNVKPSYGDELKAMEITYYDGNHRMEDIVEIGGAMRQSSKMDWESLGLNSTREDKLLCHENFKNDDFGIETFVWERPDEIRSSSLL